MWPFPETRGHMSRSEFQIFNSIQMVFFGERGKLRDVLLWIYTVGHGGPLSVISKSITPLTGVMATYRVCNSIYNWKLPTLYPPPLNLPLFLAGGRGGSIYIFPPALNWGLAIIAPQIPQPSANSADSLSFHF